MIGVAASYLMFNIYYLVRDEISVARYGVKKPALSDPYLDLLLLVRILRRLLSSVHPPRSCYRLNTESHSYDYERRLFLLLLDTLSFEVERYSLFSCPPPPPSFLGAPSRRRPHPTPPPTTRFPFMLWFRLPLPRDGVRARALKRPTEGESGCPMRAAIRRSMQGAAVDS